MPFHCILNTVHNPKWFKRLNSHYRLGQRACLLRGLLTKNPDGDRYKAFINPSHLSIINVMPL